MWRLKPKALAFKYYLPVLPPVNYCSKTALKEKVCLLLVYTWSITHSETQESEIGTGVPTTEITRLYKRSLFKLEMRHSLIIL